MFRDDKAWSDYANSRRIALSCSPSQSNFRVFAILIVEDVIKLKYQLIEGANSEQGYIGGAICAERAALVKIRFLEESHAKIRKVIVVTDNTEPISPGLLCREYLMSYCEISTPVVMGSCSSEKVISCELGSLYPFPYAYRLENRDNLCKVAGEISKVLTMEMLDEDMAKAYRAAVAAVVHDRTISIHPLQLAAAIIFETGDIEVAWQLKGLEYGCTLDPVSQLVSVMERRKICSECSVSTSTDESVFEQPQFKYSSLPKYLVMVDQFGVAHAPFAQARALLYEHGFGDIRVIVHNMTSKELEIVLASSLAPQPQGGRLLSHDDFVGV